MSERQIGVALDNFVLKYQRQAINENVEETLISQHKRLIKRNRGEDKYGQEGGPAFIITTAVVVREVCVVEGDRARENAKLEDKGKIEKRQTEANRAKKQ